MHKFISLVTVVGLIAAIASAAPACFDSDAHEQEVFFLQSGGRHPKLPTRPRNGHGGIIYLPPQKAPNNYDLNALMEELIDEEMATTYLPLKYIHHLKDTLCEEKENGDIIYNCKIDIISSPVIRIIPTKVISREIFCSSSTCSIGVADTVSVSTTHSDEDSLPITAGARPFEIGMEFTDEAGYGYSQTTQELTELYYNYDLVQGDMGHVSLISVEVSASMHITGCRLNTRHAAYPLKALLCSITGPTLNEVGHHESVILKNGQPRGYVSFVHTN
jgi:hypothetical protein